MTLCVKNCFGKGSFFGLALATIPIPTKLTRLRLSFLEGLLAEMAIGDSAAKGLHWSGEIKNNAVLFYLKLFLANIKVVYLLAQMVYLSLLLRNQVKFKFYGVVCVDTWIRWVAAWMWIFAWSLFIAIRVFVLFFFNLRWVVFMWRCLGLALFVESVLFGKSFSFDLQRIHFDISFY